MGLQIQLSNSVLVSFSVLILIWTWSQITAISALSVNDYSNSNNANSMIDANYIMGKLISIDRRDMILKSAGAATVLGFGNVLPVEVAHAIDGGLAAKLSKRDASVLKKSAFNFVPEAQVYPEFMRGKWAVEGTFRGFLFPSQSIPKDQIVSKSDIPGFQKCSIAQTCDVGRELVSYEMNIDISTGLEDRYYNLEQVIDANLGYEAVEEIIYDKKTNPNRISVAFVKNRTRNAERIELFYNARESELVQSSDGSKSSIFVNSEYIRQVTFSLSTEFGVARQAIGNYAHFWTWREQQDSDTMTGNLLTAAYLDPNDPLFFQEPAKPVAIYSQNLVAKRIK